MREWEKGILVNYGFLGLEIFQRQSVLLSPVKSTPNASCSYSCQSGRGETRVLTKFPKFVKSLIFYHSPMKRQLQGSDSSDYSNSDCLEIRKHEDDDISVSEMMLRKRKKLKTATTLLEPSSSSGAWKRNWTKAEELLILEVCNF